MSFEDVNFEEVSFEDLDFSHRRTVRIGNSPLLSFHPHLTVYAVSLADGTVITNGLPDDLTKAICEIFIIEQFAGAGGARARRSRHLTDENRHIQERRRQANNKKKNDPLSGHSRPPTLLGCYLSNPGQSAGLEMVPFDACITGRDLIGRE
jgi:hypothetical protein